MQSNDLAQPPQAPAKGHVVLRHFDLGLSHKLRELGFWSGFPTSNAEHIWLIFEMMIALEVCADHKKIVEVPFSLVNMSNARGSQP